MITSDLKMISSGMQIRSTPPPLTSLWTRSISSAHRSTKSRSGEPEAGRARLLNHETALALLELSLARAVMACNAPLESDSDFAPPCCVWVADPGTELASVPRESLVARALCPTPPCKAPWQRSGDLFRAFSSLMTFLSEVEFPSLDDKSSLALRLVVTGSWISPPAFTGESPLVSRFTAFPTWGLKSLDRVLEGGNVLFSSGRGLTLPRERSPDIPPDIPPEVPLARFESSERVPKALERPAGWKPSTFKLEPNDSFERETQSLALFPAV